MDRFRDPVPIVKSVVEWCACCGEGLYAGDEIIRDHFSGEPYCSEYCADEAGVEEEDRIWETLEDPRHSW